MILKYNYLIIPVFLDRKIKWMSQTWDFQLAAANPIIGNKPALIFPKLAKYLTETKAVSI